MGIREATNRPLQRWEQDLPASNDVLAVPISKPRTWSCFHIKPRPLIGLGRDPSLLILTLLPFV